MNPVLPHLQQIQAPLLVPSQENNMNKIAVMPEQCKERASIDCEIQRPLHRSSEPAYPNAATMTAGFSKLHHKVVDHSTTTIVRQQYGKEENVVKRSMLSILLDEHQSEELTTTSINANVMSSVPKHGIVDHFVACNGVSFAPISPPSTIRLPEIPLVPHVVRPSGDMMQQRRVLEDAMTERLQQVRLDSAVFQHQEQDGSSSQNSSSSTRVAPTFRRKHHQSSNEARKFRREMHHKAIIQDLTEIVTDLFLAESKLVHPSKYGVATIPTMQREQVFKSIQKFITSLPTRYALGAESPSEVLIHMRLMAAVRADPTRPAVHIANLDDNGHTDNAWPSQSLASASSSFNTRVSTSASADTSATPNAIKRKRLVTICCKDEHGLLQFISRVLATGGSRVLDADVMLSNDNIALDRFVVEMNGRLRLDKLAQYVGDFLAQTQPGERRSTNNDETSILTSQADRTQELAIAKSPDLPGPVYFRKENMVPPRRCFSSFNLATAIPMERALKLQTTNSRNLLSTLDVDQSFLPLSRSQSVLLTAAGSNSCALAENQKNTKPNDVNSFCSARDEDEASLVAPKEITSSAPDKSTRQLEGDTDFPQERPLIRREGISDLDFVSFNQRDALSPTHDSCRNNLRKRNIPVIPFDELMLIETLGVGRVSTIYRAVWQPKSMQPKEVRMLALKVAMMNPETRDSSHINELRREFEIAACLQHPNISHLVGIAKDDECFCLAYEYCEGGSLFSLVSDHRRCYEYLPIALDIVQGMAYLHSRNVIHRDLKLSNVLLDVNNRAMISDFGMSVELTGQELTAETGTYRYMAPEVIRHESYSSNADVYSFGVCLWQLITRDIPFASMTPIQAAFRVAQGERPLIPESTPSQLREIIKACWDQDSNRRPSFTWVAMALYDYASSAFSPATVSTQTLRIANEMIANVEGNSTVNVDFSTPLVVVDTRADSHSVDKNGMDHNIDVGLEI